MDPDAFFYGREKAEIRADRIHSRIFQAQASRTAQEMNSAFEIYYAAWTSANKITDRARTPNGYSILQDFQAKVFADLRDVGDKNWTFLNWGGIGKGMDAYQPVTSLHGIFRHLAKNNGHWYDETWEPWKPGTFTSDVKVPPGINSLYQAIEERKRESVSNYNDWLQVQAALHYNAQYGEKFGESWEKLGDKLQKTGWVIEKIGPKLWALAKTPEELIEGRNSLVVKCFELGENTHDCMVRYNTITNQGSRAKEVRALLVDIASQIVQKVPIFGQSYGVAIASIPGLIDWAVNVAKTHYGEYANPSPF
jgi:hypothetical protein